MTDHSAEIAARLTAVRDRIAAACASAGRTAGEVRLIAVCKRIPLDKVLAACQAGQWDLAENRIQEAIGRQSELAAQLEAAGMAAERVRWHFVGHLQRNKAGKAAGAFALLHAVHSFELARRLEAEAAALGIVQPFLIEVNASGEPQKQGVAPDQAVELLIQTAQLSHCRPLGMMTMARYGAPESELRRTFSGLRSLNEEARRQTGLPLPELSMGMSEDFEAAIAEGATLVRIGTAIFGERQPRQTLPG